MKEKNIKILNILFNIFFISFISLIEIFLSSIILMIFQITPTNFIANLVIFLILCLINYYIMFYTE